MVLNKTVPRESRFREVCVTVSFICYIPYRFQDLVREWDNTCTIHYLWECLNINIGYISWFLVKTRLVTLRNGAGLLKDGVSTGTWLWRILCIVCKRSWENLVVSSSCVCFCRVIYLQDTKQKKVIKIMMIYF